MNNEVPVGNGIIPLRYTIRIHKVMLTPSILESIAYLPLTFLGNNARFLFLDPTPYKGITLNE
jgi:hypothetical protein